MTEEEAKDRQWYYRELMSEQCLCERPKKARYSFCYRCYKSLPFHLQKELYKGLGAGYEEAFEEAVKFLETEVW